MSFDVSSIHTTTLVVPADLVRKCCGVSLDIGASTLKAVYRTQQNIDEANLPDAKLGHLELVLLSKQQLDEALAFVKSRAVVRRGEVQLKVCTTGLGCTD